MSERLTIYPTVAARLAAVRQAHDRRIAAFAALKAAAAGDDYEAVRTANTELERVSALHRRVLQERWRVEAAS